MPIKNLSETRRLPRLGKIHLGTKHPEKGYPQKADHFIFPESVKDAVIKLYGEKPVELDIIIPVEDDEFWCSQYYRSYSRTQGLVCKGDGDMAYRKIDTDTGTMADHNTKQVAMRDIVCPGRNCPDYQAKKCKEVMNLQFLMPKLGGLGIWQVDTSSINSIININSCAALIRGVFKRVSMIPLKLTLESKEVNNPETGKKQTVFVMNLRHDGTLYQQLEGAAKLQQQFGVLALPPAPDDTEEPDDVEVPGDHTKAEKDIVDLYGPNDNPRPNNDAAFNALESANKQTPAVEVKTSAPAAPPANSKPVNNKQATNPWDSLPDLMIWLSGHGKTYTPSWLCKQLNVKQPDEIKDLQNAYGTIKQITGWEN